MISIENPHCNDKKNWWEHAHWLEKSSQERLLDSTLKTIRRMHRLMFFLNYRVASLLQRMIIIFFMGKLLCLPVCHFYFISCNFIYFCFIILLLALPPASWVFQRGWMGILTSNLVINKTGYIVRCYCT